MMDRRHQVFVSSTYEDLVMERQHVIHALLELDCMPAGMEMLPASDEDAWSLIKGVIDDSDYYILVVAGRYGSLDEDGISFTEREYDYAASSGKPVIAFLHEKPSQLLAGQCEVTDEGRSKLDAFREKVKAHHCKMWSSADDLGGKVSRSLIQLRKRRPSPGWVPGRFASEALLGEMETMRARILELEAVEASGPPDWVEELAQGSDLVWLRPTLFDGKGGWDKHEISASWDKLFSYVGPSLAGECHEDELLEKVRLAFWHAVPPESRESNSFDKFSMPKVVFDKIKVQLQALTLMTAGVKRRAVSDVNRYWRLTPYGERYLLRLLAVRRPAKPADEE